MNLSKNVKVTIVNTGAAAAQTAVNSSSVDMSGWEGVVFIVLMGAITAGGVQSCNLAQSANNSSFADLEGSGQTIADDDDNTAFVMDVFRPGDRYVRAEIARATQNSAVTSIVAIQYGPRKMPTTNDSTTVSGTETHISPAEGTA